MRQRSRVRLLVCLAAGLAALGLHAVGEGAFGTLQLAEAQNVVATHADLVAGPVAARAEALARDEVDRPTVRLGSLLALGACAFALTAIGHHRLGVVLAGASPPH